MKKYLMTGITALTLCAGFTSCSHDFEPMTQEEIDKAKYDQAFLKYVGGKIAADQDWGFGTTDMLTRAAVYWTDSHNHVDGCTGWEGKLDFTLPEGAVQIDTDDNIGKTWDGNIDYTWDGKTYYKIPSGNVLYISDKFEGDLVLSEGFNSDVTIYNYGKVTNISLNYVNGTITYYNAGTLAFNLTSGTHIFYNGADGELTLNGYANVGHVYNNGELYLANSDLRNDLTVHSASLGIVYFPNGAASGDGLQSTLDIHGKAKVTGDMKIGNEKTQYICELEVEKTLNLTKGHLQTSYVKANEITFDGDRLYLLPGAHVVATTMRMPNSDTYVYASRGSNALIELKDIYMQNTNNFNDSFDDNIYFDITGVVDFSNSTLFGGGAKHYNSVAEYIADKGNLSNDRLDGGYATGSPVCGLPWTVGTPKTEVYDLRIIAEDLSATDASDFDFNDVVFDVKYGNPVKIKLLAAGGTLPLYVGGVEVHGKFGVESTDIMINTNAGAYGKAATCDPVEFELPGVSVADAAEANTKIEVKVMKNGVEQTLTAVKGEPAAKLAVDTTYEWLDERQSIKDNYEFFVDWANGTHFTSKWWE